MGIQCMYVRQGRQCKHDSTVTIYPSGWEGSLIVRLIDVREHTCVCDAHTGTAVAQELARRGVNASLVVVCTNI